MNEHSNPTSDPRQTSGLDAELEKELNEALGDQSIEQLMEQAEAESRAQEEAQAQSQPPATGGEATASPGHRSTAASESGRRQESGQAGQRGEVKSLVRRGRIQAIQGEDVLVELHAVEGKNTGIVPLAQFDRPPRAGAIMDFVIQRYDENEGLYIVSREGAVGEATWEQLAAGAAVEARVTAANKGGLELELVGRIRGFMPASQIDLHHVDDLEQWVGQKVQATVQEVDRKRRRVLLSRRRFLEEQRERQRQQTWQKLEEGAVMDGTVSNMTDYGVFVDIGGVDGLVHISDLSHSHIDKPSDVVSRGQQVQVKVLKLDREKDRVRLGMKQVAPDPWEGIESRYTVGGQVNGRILRVANFGAFVELEPGIEGLLPVSEMSWRRHVKPEEIVSADQEVRLSIVGLDPDKRRLTLSLKQTEGDPWMGAEHRFPKNSVVEGRVRATTDFGAFIELEPGLEGLVHISELAPGRVNRVTDVLKDGDTDRFRVIEIDEEAKRLKLSRKQVEQPDEEAAAEAQADKTEPSKSKAAKKPPPRDLRGGLGNVGGVGLGDLKL